MTAQLTPEEINALVAENLLLHETLDKVKEAARFGARMDVHPTRMGGSADTLKEGMWWQNWLIQFDKNWRDAISRALSTYEAAEPVTPELQQRLILRVLDDATLAELMDSPEEISHRIIEALRG
jgi:hypothetical protein